MNTCLRQFVPVLLCLAILLSLSAFGDPGPSEKVAVLIGKEEPRTLQLAADELSQYLSAMLSRPVPLYNMASDIRAGMRVFVVATPDGRLDLPEPITKRIRSLELGPDGCMATYLAPYLVLAGNTGRGAANAIWTYLEDYCHVGFFWSGDQIPQIRSLPFEGVSFQESPHFQERYMSPPGGYTLSEHMNWDDWKREIDWRAHKRQNIIYGGGGELIWKRIFAELAGKTYVPSEPERLQDDLSGQTIAYARERGLMLIMPGFMGEVPAEFVAAHPEVRYLGGIRWGETPMNKHVYPSDPMFHELSARYIQGYVKRYGLPTYYFVPPYPEAAPGETPDEKHALKKDLADAVQRVRDEVCPSVMWMADSWAFLTAEFWPPDEVRTFCDAVVDRGRFRIYDTWGEERPMWTLHNAYWGNSWWLGVLQCFGGNTGLHGDIYSLARDVRRVTTDPLAGDCVGLSLVPEAVHHNDLYFDLALRMGWNPDAAATRRSQVDLGSFLNDYALRRYGARSASRMRKALDILAHTVYSTKDMTQPVYLHQLYTVLDFPNASVYAPPEHMAWTPKLRRALDIMLSEAGQQAPNPLYERDLLDLARRYLGDLFNGVIPDVLHAWRLGDRERFEQAARDTTRLIECTRDVLASSSWYRLEARFDRTRRRADFAELAAQTRNVMSIWEGSANYDYVRRDDLAELMEGNYLPRYKAWLDRLRTVESAKWSQADDDGLTQTYLEIGRKWVKEGATLLPPSVPPATAVKNALVSARTIEQPRPPVVPHMVNADFARQLDGWSLSSRRMDLSMQPSPDGGTGKALAYRTWPKSGAGNMYVFQTIKAEAADIALDCRVDECGESGFAGLRVEGYDADFRRVVECTYQWGDAWNYWPDRYRPDNVTPDWNIGPCGMVWWWVPDYSIKQRLGRKTDGWQHVQARLPEDFDRVHGTGTWKRLGVKSLRIALVASTRRVEDPIAGAFANLSVNVKR